MLFEIELFQKKQKQKQNTTKKKEKKEKKGKEKTSNCIKSGLSHFYFYNKRCNMLL